MSPQGMEMMPHHLARAVHGAGSAEAEIARFGGVQSGRSMSRTRRGAQPQYLTQTANMGLPSGSPTLPCRLHFSAGRSLRLAMILSVLDLLGTFAFALSGAFRAVKHELDWLGLAVLATATGVGGGIFRDILLGATPPAALSDETVLIVCLLGGGIALLGKHRIAQHWDLVMLADAMGLGVFAAIGAAKAESMHTGPLTLICMAAITATGGGVVRDLLVNEIPAVLHSDFYATAALIGGAVYWVAAYVGLPLEARLFCTVLGTTTLRLLAMRHKMHLPKVKSLPDSPSALTARRRAPPSGLADT